MFDNMFGEDFMLSEAETLDGMRKAISADYGYGDAPGTRTQGSAMMTESLDSTLKAVTWNLKALKIWPMIAKERAFNVVEEYDRQTSYGEQSEGGFFNPNNPSLPIEGTAQVNRQIQKVRYIGTYRQVTHPMTLVRTVNSSAIAIQVESGTKWILEQMERQLWMANGYFVDPATGVADGDTADLPVDDVVLKFNGIDQQIRYGQIDTKAQYQGFDGYSGNNDPILNMATAGVAAVPDEDDLTQLAYIQSTNHGVPTDFFCSLKTAADISRQLLPKEWISPPGQEGRGGFVLTSFISASGVFNIVPSRFLQPRTSPLSSASSSAPSAPTISGTSTEADTTSELVAGTYYYKVSAVGQYAESIGSSQSSQAVTAGNRVTLTIAAGTTGAIGYNVFRSSVSGSDWKFIGSVKDSTGNGGGATFRDHGDYLPGAAHAYLMEQNNYNLMWRQLAPLLKLDLATISPAIRWMQLLYGTPIVYAPLHHAIMDNIGEA